MALPEEVLTLIAKNQHEKDPYLADMLDSCLNAVIAYYNKKNDNLLNETIKIIKNTIQENTLINALQAENITSDIIASLEPKELLEAQITVTVAGKKSTSEEERERLRGVYKKIIEIRDLQLTS